MTAHCSSYIHIFTISLVLLLKLCALVEGAAFRFCHGGTWHEVTSDLCPYGVYFIEPVSTVCYYSVLDNSTATPAQLPRIWRTPCFKPVSSASNSKAYRALELEDFTITQRWGMFQFIQHLQGYPHSLPEWGYFTTMQECLMSCHGRTNDDYDDHESSDSVEDQITRVIPFLNETEKKAQTDQTLRLGNYLYDQLIKQDMNPGPDLRIVRLFKKTIEIMRRTCQHPFVHNDFVTRVLYGFLFLIEDNGVGEVEDVSIEEYDAIMEALNVCGQTPPSFRLEGKACTIISEVESVVHTDDNGNELTADFIPKYYRKPEEKKFPYKTYDIVVESAWQAVQVVHGACFATFQSNANMHHRYTTAMEQLFGQKIMLRWRYPTQLIDSKLWGTWFLADVDSTYMNTIACVKASYQNAPFAMHLDRPIDWNRHSEKRAKIVRKKRSVRRFNEPSDYWQNYEQTGGIVTKMLDKLRCFESESERDEVFSNYRLSTCPDIVFDNEADFGPGSPEPNLDANNIPIDHAHNPAHHLSGRLRELDEEEVTEDPLEPLPVDPIGPQPQPPIAPPPVDPIGPTPVDSIGPPPVDPIGPPPVDPIGPPPVDPIGPPPVDPIGPPPVDPIVPPPPPPIAPPPPPPIAPPPPPTIVPPPPPPIVAPEAPKLPTGEDDMVKIDLKPRTKRNGYYSESSETAEQGEE